jgi:hypothetical protein
MIEGPMTAARITSRACQSGIINNFAERDIKKVPAMR